MHVNLSSCWTADSPYIMYILSCPVCISMVLNLLFLCNIVRVLLVKLRAGPHVQTANRPSRTAVQALRYILCVLINIHTYVASVTMLRNKIYLY